MFGRQSLREFIRTEQEKTWARIDKEQEKTREFEREILLRNEKVYTSVVAELERMAEETRENTERTKAGTQAILRLLDRFDDSGSAPA
jgi:P2-related tail formation protein